MKLSTRSFVSALALASLAAGIFPAWGWAAAQEQLPPFPNDMSLAGVRASIHNGADPALFESVLPEGGLEAVQAFGQLDGQFRKARQKHSAIGFTAGLEFAGIFLDGANDRRIADRAAVLVRVGREFQRV